jgi:hypothetical protein
VYPSWRTLNNHKVAVSATVKLNDISPIPPLAIVPRSPGSMTDSAGHKPDHSSHERTGHSDILHPAKHSPEPPHVRFLGQSTPRRDPNTSVAIKRVSPVSDRMSLFPSTPPSISPNKLFLEPTTADPTGDFLFSIGYGQHRRIFVEKLGYTGSGGLKNLCEHAKTMTCEMRKILVEEGLTVNESLSILSKLIEKENNASRRL